MGTARDRVIADGNSCRTTLAGVGNLAYWSAEILIPRLPPSSTGSLQNGSVLSRNQQAGAVLPHFIARRQPELQIVLAREVQLTRHYFLVRHCDMSRIPRVRAVADYVAAAV